MQRVEPQLLATDIITWELTKESPRTHPRDSDSKALKWYLGIRLFKLPGGSEARSRKNQILKRKYSDLDTLRVTAAVLGHLLTCPDPCTVQHILFPAHKSPLC